MKDLHVTALKRRGAAQAALKIRAPQAPWAALKREMGAAGAQASEATAPQEPGGAHLSVPQARQI